ncbi:MAG TPA: lytic transglycosylase domain-containing protein [Thermoanaerobaculia bacterium]|nr:lytic transglycosylase domain-containing protein [Thermoanaerobaculia bacterium]
MTVKWKRTRAIKYLVFVFAFFVISLHSAPSTPSTPPITAPPDPHEVATLKELSDWVLGSGSSGAVAGMSENDVVAAVRHQRQSFDLFRDFNGPEAGRRLLSHMPYGREISSVAKRNRLDGLLVAAVVATESSFNPHAVSAQGAVGLMQVLPATARRFGVSNPLKPASNLEAGARYLHSLLERYNGDLALALAAYNAGPEAVRRYGGVPPFRETRRYVQRVLDRYVESHREVWRGTDLERQLRLAAKTALPEKDAASR